MSTTEPVWWPKDRVFYEEYRGYPVYYVPSDKMYWTPASYNLTLGRMSLDSIHANIDDLIAKAEEKGEAPSESLIPTPKPPTPTPPPPAPEPAPPAPVEVPKPFELPGLPWYVSWLQPVLEFLGTLVESVVNFFAPVFAPLGDIVKGLADLPGTIVGAFLERLGDLFSDASNRGAEIAVKTASDVASGSPPWMTAFEEQIARIYTPVMKEYSKALDVKTYEKSPLTGDEAVAALQDIRNKVLAVAIANFVQHALIESGSLGQFEWMRDLDSIVTSKFGLTRVIERATMLPIEKAVITPAEQEFNTRYPTQIPTYTDLINMVVKEVIPLDRFVAEMAKLGFRTEWAEFIWDAHFKPPDWTELRNAYYRGAIKVEELMSFKILVDLDPRYNVVWDSLIEQIPPYSELVNELVKEVIDKPTFLKYMKWYGFDEAWAQRIWDAHFIPPALGDMLTAWRRGLITEKRLDDLMIIVDLDPRFKEIFDTRKYIDPSIRTGRYMFEAGAIDRERVKEIVKLEGYREEDVEPITEFLTTFQEREFRTSYLRALATGTIYGAYTEEELRKEVKAAGYSDAVADWMLKIAEVREKTTGARKRAPSPKLLTEANLKRAYILDYIDEPTIRVELGLRGYPVGDVDILIRLLNEEKVTVHAGGQKLALSQGELLNALRYNEMTEDAVRIELQLRGLTPEEVDVLIRTKRKQWGETPE